MSIYPVTTYTDAGNPGGRPGDDNVPRVMWRVFMELACEAIAAGNDPLALYFLAEADEASSR